MSKKSELVYSDHDFWFVLIAEADYPEFVHDVVSTMSGEWQCELYWSDPSRSVEMLKWSGPEAPDSGITIIAGEDPKGILLQISAPETCNKSAQTLIERLLSRGTLIQHASPRLSNR